MKLWNVTIERELYVVAETEREAEEIARRNEHKEFFHNADVYAYEVTDVRRVDADWRDSIPYGKANDKTVAQVLSPDNLSAKKPP